jgi:hypothetical protein
MADIRRVGCQAILSAPERDGMSLLAIIVRIECVSTIPSILHARLVGVVWCSGGGYQRRLYNIYRDARGSSHSHLD